MLPTVDKIRTIEWLFNLNTGANEDVSLML